MKMNQLKKKTIKDSITISQRIKRHMLRRAVRKASAAGFDRILPAGLKTTMDDCFTVDRVSGGRVFIMLYFNMPGGNTWAVRHVVREDCYAR